jgi:hypothetical protein
MGRCDGSVWVIHWFWGMFWTLAGTSGRGVDEDRDLGRAVMKRMRRALGVEVK